MDKWELGFCDLESEVYNSCLTGKNKADHFVKYEELVSARLCVAIIASTLGLQCCKIKRFLVLGEDMRRWLDCVHLLDPFQ